MRRRVATRPRLHVHDAVAGGRIDQPADPRALGPARIVGIAEHVPRHVFDMDGLRELMTAIRARQVRTVVVDTERASPFASTLVFDYIGQYMYDGDAPLAERRAQRTAGRRG